MFENYDDILTVDDIAEALKIGSTQAYKIIQLIEYINKRSQLNLK